MTVPICKPTRYNPKLGYRNHLTARDAVHEVAYEGTAQRTTGKYGLCKASF